jgi:hypothetical protein
MEEHPNLTLVKDEMPELKGLRGYIGVHQAKGNYCSGAEGMAFLAKKALRAKALKWLAQCLINKVTNCGS